MRWKWKSYKIVDLKIRLKSAQNKNVTIILYYNCTKIILRFINFLVSKYLLRIGNNLS